MARFRMKPSKDEIFAKHSSLAVALHEDSKHEFSLYVWNRRTRTIVAQYKIPLLEHCRKGLLDIDPIKK